jgi:hypothetical protein
MHWHNWPIELRAVAVVLVALAAVTAYAYWDTFIRRRP